MFILELRVCTPYEGYDQYNLAVSESIEKITELREELVEQITNLISNDEYSKTIRILNKEITFYPSQLCKTEISKVEVI